MTNPQIAAQAMALNDVGYPSTQIGRMLDIAQRTAHDIINLHGNWGEVAERPVFARLRLDQKKHLEATSRMLSAKCLIQVDKTIEKASAYQAAGIYGLLRTHERLDAGEPTEIIGHIQDRRSVESLEALAAALSQTLIARQQDQTTVITEQSKVSDAVILK
jgi:hypothetical protein